MLSTSSGSATQFSLRTCLLVQCYTRPLLYPLASMASASPARSKVCMHTLCCSGLACLLLIVDVVHSWLCWSNQMLGKPSLWSGTASADWSTSPGPAVLWLAEQTRRLPLQQCVELKQSILVFFTAPHRHREPCSCLSWWVTILPRTNLINDHMSYLKLNIGQTQL